MITLSIIAIFDYRFTTYQDARRVRLVDGLTADGLKPIFYEYHPLIF